MIKMESKSKNDTVAPGGKNNDPGRQPESNKEQE